MEKLQADLRTVHTSALEWQTYGKEQARKLREARDELTGTQAALAAARAELAATRAELAKAAAGRDELAAAVAKLSRECDSLRAGHTRSPLVPPAARWAPPPAAGSAPAHASTGADRGGACAPLAAPARRAPSL